MEAVKTEPRKLHAALVVLGSLIVVWSVAFLVPSQYDKIQDKLPSVKVEYNRGRSPYNESKLALLIEDRPLGHIAPLLQHMMSVVPPDWRFLFLGSPESLNETTSSVASQLHQATGKLTMREIPRNGSWSMRELTNRLLTNMTFFEEYTDPAEWLLVFQADSILCAQSEISLDDWLHYDWVGAPWNSKDHFGGSGGLSLRRMSRIKEVLQFQSRQDEGSVEDRWLVDRVGLLPESNMASPQVEAGFSVEAIWHEKPMGYHIGSSGIGVQLHKEIWDNERQRRHIFEYCPEIKMIMDMRFRREQCSEEETRRIEEEKKHKEDLEQQKADMERNKKEEAEGKKGEEAEGKKEGSKESGK